MSNPYIVACIPAFNEESSIGSVIVRAMKHVDKVVVCDDGSRDLTGEIARGLGAVVVRHERNMGYGAALRSLFKEALRLEANMVVTLDADGQHDPEEIPWLLERIEVGDADIVIGSRFLEGGGSEAPRWREKGVKLITGMVSRNGLRLSDAQSGFRAYKRRALESLVLAEEGMGASTEILLKAQENGLRIIEAPIKIRYNKDSSTHNPLLHGINVVLSIVKHFSIRRPLIFYGIPGFTALCVAAFFWNMTLKMFTSTRMIITNITLVAFAATIIGLMLMITSIILWVLISVVREKI